MTTKAQRAKPHSRKFAMSVNKAADSPGLHATLYRIRVGIWAQLLKNDPTGIPTLVLVPRENKGAYREGMLLIKEGFASCECSGKDTLYLRRAKYCDEKMIRDCLSVASVRATNSPAHY